MRVEAVDAAYDLAERFLACCRDFITETECNEGDCRKQSGALRRASMDLTRALAEMRRPG